MADKPAGRRGGGSPARKAAPKTKPAKPKAEVPATSGPRLRVKQVRSGIGHAQSYRRTLRALGLRHHQAEVVLPDNASVRGMLDKVRHLVRVQAGEA